MKKRRILAVEDSPTQGELIRYELESRGFDVVLETNGQRALEALPKVVPDIVVTDILMPEVDGYDLCLAIKKSERWRNIPVILVTGLSDPVEVLRALECGADGFIVKPYATENLISRVNSVIAESGRPGMSREGEGVEVVYKERTFSINASRRHILGLLLSTYETAVEKNAELLDSRERIRRFNENLELKVRVRTSALAQEVADRRSAQKRLTEANEALERRARQLRNLAMELTRTEQAERQRLAGVLHDHLQQLLVGAKMVSGVERKRTSHDPKKLEDSLGKIEGLLGEAIQISRDLTVELSPPVLREGGLAAGLEWLARRMKEQYAMTVHTDVDREADSCAGEVRTFLFQAARELLFNVLKHAGTQEANVSGTREGEMVVLTVSDSGKGFDPEAQARKQEQDGKSFGLFSLEERMEVLGGRMEIVSRPGHGTKISLAVPADPEVTG